MKTAYQNIQNGACRLLRLIALLVVLSVPGIIPRAHGQAIVFNIQTAWEDTFSLSPSYTGGADSLGSATTIVANGLYRWSQGFPPFPNLTEPGHWVFAGWSYSVPSTPNDVPYMQFSFTASQPVSLGLLDYTFFSGNWSDLWIGPDNLQVWVSRDGFETSTLAAYHSLLVTHPFTGAEITYHDDLSLIGDLMPGETLSVRFVASYFSQPHAEAPAGFLYAVSGPQTQLTLGISAVPEPGLWAMIAGAVALSGAMIRRRKRERLP